MVKAATRPGRPRRSGRPSRAQAERIKDQILDVAAALFFEHGYGATSIEAVARRMRMSKRTFYHRFRDKSELFKAVVLHIIDRLRPKDQASFSVGPSIEDILLRLGQLILHAALTPDALAMQRMVLAEAGRFPELAATVNQVGARQEAITYIATLLAREAGANKLKVKDPAFAAEQFLNMIITSPQRRALGLGAPMTKQELDAWVPATVQLFLNGCR